MPLDQTELVAVANTIQQLTVKPADTFIYISIQQQMLYYIEALKVCEAFAISSAKQGVGCAENSFKTPIGLHTIAEKIGDQAPLNMVFKERQATGQLAIINSQTAKTNDEITTRLLWLQGEQAGVNQGAGVDSYQRYIYIHGTSNEAAIGEPASMGCIRMLNKDVITLFARVELGCLVYIK